MVSELRQRLNRELDGAAGERRARFLHRALTALEGVEPEMLPRRGAGFGSTVLLAELDSGARLAYTLMAGDVIDLDAGEISLASPVGQALLGRVAGDEVSVFTPLGRRRFRVESVERLGDEVVAAEAAVGVRVA